jgi:histidine triad (HIT) family protein
VVPKAHHPNVGELANHDPVLAGQVLASAVAVAEREGLVDDGYRLIFNTGAHGGQEVDHVHVHVVGGAPLGPMLSR